MMVDAARLMGRCADGAERDSGRRLHAVRPGEWTALCGARPGRRSAGWAVDVDHDVNCPRCLRRYEVPA